MADREQVRKSVALITRVYNDIHTNAFGENQVREKKKVRNEVLNFRNNNSGSKSFGRQLVLSYVLKFF